MWWNVIKNFAKKQIFFVKIQFCFTTRRKLKKILDIRAVNIPQLLTDYATITIVG